MTRGAASRGLFSRADIMDYMKVSNNKFYRLVKAGLPAFNREGTWVANKDLIDAWSRDPDRPAASRCTCESSGSFVCPVHGIGTDYFRARESRGCKHPVKLF